MAFQYPSEISGVTIANFIRAAVQARLPDGESSMRPNSTRISTRRWTPSR